MDAAAQDNIAPNETATQDGRDDGPTEQVARHPIGTKGASMTTLPSVASLWIGPSLTWLEELCLKSFVDHGHRVILYTYDDVARIPEGVEQRPATEVMPGREIIRHGRTDSPALHSDLFRVELMRRTEHVWVDTDAYCHAPLILPDHGHLHGMMQEPPRLKVNGGVLRLPPESDSFKELDALVSNPYPIPEWFSDEGRAELQALHDAGTPRHVRDMNWGVFGPNALLHILQKTGEIRHTLTPDALYPLDFANTRWLFHARSADRVARTLTDRTMSIHLWGRRFRNVAATMFGIPEPDSYVEMLCRKHGIDPAPTAARFTRSNPAHIVRINEVLGRMPDLSLIPDEAVLHIAEAAEVPSFKSKGTQDSDEAIKRRPENLRAGLADAVDVWTRIADHGLPDQPKVAIVDPCEGLIALAAALSGASVTLLPLEEDADGFAAVADLLKANGIPAMRIATRRTLTPTSRAFDAIIAADRTVRSDAARLVPLLQQTERAGGTSIVSLRRGDGQARAFRAFGNQSKMPFGKSARRRLVLMPETSEAAEVA